MSKIFECINIYSTENAVWKSTPILLEKMLHKFNICYLRNKETNQLVTLHMQSAKIMQYLSFLHMMAIRCFYYKLFLTSSYFLPLSFLPSFRFVFVAFLWLGFTLFLAMLVFCTSQFWPSAFWKTALMRKKRDQVEGCMLCFLFESCTFSNTTSNAFQTSFENLFV